ncbi:hypothetical protein GH714_007902 [Hevea brasiliensis]|uniref:Uncharacterized protein n=1 Tax=Hevea brasiliensis TaxID=3981 RepID=A0A6A6LZD5_HEVBR|nr:hypothetical protein GH714_007902 [Hevea brasiliensis]
MIINMLTFALNKCVTTSGSSQKHLLQAPLLDKFHGTKASLQKEDSITDSRDGGGYKGHDMLAPFTVGWQSTDLHPLVIEKSEGSYVYDINGKKYLDSLAGLWCTALGETEEEFSTRLANNLESLILKEGPETIAAFIAEPVMGAGGVIPPQQLILRRLEVTSFRQEDVYIDAYIMKNAYIADVQAVVKKYDILFIADEVICAFGRLGTMFGCDKYNIKPDLVSVAKVLSSAYMPIGDIMVSPEVADVIYSQSNKLGDNIMMSPPLIITPEEIDENKFVH